MAYYTALINAWQSTTQPPAGVTGTGLSASNTQAQNLALINAWTITGVIPTSIYVTGTQLFNCINYAEFSALTAAQQQTILDICEMPGQLLGGSSNTSFLVDGEFLAIFSNHSGPTITALTALAMGTVTPWWQANGYSSPFGVPDLQAAGLNGVNPG